MNTSKLLIALIGSIALPLAASAQGYQSGSQSGGQSGSSQQYQSGSQSGTSQSGASQSGTSQSDMGRQSGQGTMERGSSGSSGMGRDTGAAGAEGSAGLPMFDTLDTNKDGMISKTEAKKSATAKRDFRNLDSNHDGKISREEWQAGGGQGATNQ